MEPIIEGFFIGALSIVLGILIIYLVYSIFIKRKKHTLDSIKNKLQDLIKASETIKKNSDELNKIMEDLENA